VVWTTEAARASSAVVSELEGVDDGGGSGELGCSVGARVTMQANHS
jgi:hypothetical protein